MASTTGNTWPPVHTHHSYCPTSSSIKTTSTSFLIALSTLLLALLALTTDAQAPVARRRLAYVQHNNQLYLQGGIAQAGLSNQFNALDLTKPWSTASPSWTMLGGGNWVSHHTMVAVDPEHSAGLGSGAQGYLLSIGGNPASSSGFWSTYDIQSGTWANLTTPAPYIGLEGQAAVSDPSTGQVYIVGGYYTDATTNATVANRLTVYDPTSNSVVMQQAATDKTNLTGAAVVWSTKRNTILSFGGSRATSSSAVSGLQMGTIDEYDPASKIWKTMATTGNVPTRALDACAAASDDGSKIVLFGGSLDSNTFFSTIYTLDVVSGVWSQGVAAPDYRARMACGFHSGQFVAFGGSRGTNQMTDMQNNLPIVYDVDANAWSVNFDPNGATDGSGTGNKGAIIGGAVGGIVALIICAVGGFCFVKRRRAKRNKEAKDSEEKAAALVTESDDEIRRSQRVVHDKYNNGDNSDAYGRPGSMSPAAFQGANASPSVHAAYRQSDAFSQGVSEHDYAVGSARALSDTASQPDAQYYYQQMQLQQQPYEQQFQQQQQQYADQAAYGNMTPGSPAHSLSTPPHSFVPHQSPTNTLGGYPVSVAGGYSVPVLIQQGDGNIQGPHSWTGSYYDTQPVSGAGGHIPAVPPITYNGGVVVPQQQQPWVPSNGYYGVPTASATPTTPGFPPLDSPVGWGGSNSVGTAVDSTNGGGLNKYADDGYSTNMMTALPARGPQAVSPSSPSDYIRPPQS
ncbi:hypothetical protein KI688_012852 [Linnemannia hyalina]|uniref:Attractin/MKLN-like beta-propeller domain-containing protein n=1 Tax=Linnemannia hyalina TaxID=64524 RepID=A0A9P8BSW4_9FUNG|nr:hypothetical protein KI688_012852 [Linnemannia hyalina]